MAGSTHGRPRSCGSLWMGSNCSIAVLRKVSICSSVAFSFVSIPGFYPVFLHLVGTDESTDPPCYIYWKKETERGRTEREPNPNLPTPTGTRPGTEDLRLTLSGRTACASTCPSPEEHASAIGSHPSFVHSCSHSLTVFTILKYGGSVLFRPTLRLCEVYVTSHFPT